MKKLVYFDSNIFGHSYSESGKMTQGQINQLKAAIADGKVSVVFSILNFEEIIAMLRADKSNAKVVERLTKFALELVDYQKIIKEPMRLLTDDITAYASTGMAGNPFYSGSELSDIQRSFREGLTDFSDENLNQLLLVIEKSKSQTISFQSSMEELKKDLVVQKETRWAQVGKEQEKRERRTFEEFWDLVVEQCAAIFAQGAGVLTACQRRGITGLLNIPSVQMAAGMWVSYTYAQAFENDNPRPSDHRDMLHAVAAAATTKVFVTNERENRLPRHVSRVPMANLRAVKLAVLLDELRREDG